MEYSTNNNDHNSPTTVCTHPAKNPNQNKASYDIIQMTIQKTNCLKNPAVHTQVVCYTDREHTFEEYAKSNILPKDKKKGFALKYCD